MITIGTRKSKLAMWQAETVARFLNEAGLETKINSMETIGDKVLDRSIAKIGSKGVFTVELEEQLAAAQGLGLLKKHLKDFWINCSP